MIGDPFLNYFALGLLIFVVIVIFYGVIAIHDIPAKIAEASRTRSRIQGQRADRRRCNRGRSAGNHASPR